ncbi:phenylacetate--CoA ligase family protein [Aestuariivirga sp.]|jgi:phenylacetate-CoA ligase|uniref:phenylacetate--CoA ligase family protein n=1 Tax=Aestuariivirga sp. TaxID=2650926 RepID=UPI003782FEF3
MSGLDIAEAYLNSLLTSERASGEELDAYQSRLLQRLAKHAFEETPFYAARRVAPEGLSANSDFWLAQPYISRRDITENFDAFRPRSFSKLHGVITPLTTGGSTGPAARRDITSLEAVGRLLASYRMYHSWGLDQSRPLFVFRKLRQDQPRQEIWGFPWRDPAERGERLWIDIATPAREQLEQMAGRGPVYVNTLPSNILRLSCEALRTGTKLSIPFIVSVGEYLAPEVREAAASAFGSTIIDAFSSAEGGVMAVQCPGSGIYHIQSEQLVLEIVKTDGARAKPGETGEVVVTPLYGYATPLLRYRSGDFVVAGPACGCGRVLPAIASIAGRREHMFTRPGEAPELPKIDRFRLMQTIGHDEWLLAQLSEDDMEFRYAGSLTASQEQAIGEHLHAVLGGRLRSRFTNVEALPLTSGGKRHFTLNAGVLPPA